MARLRLELEDVAKQFGGRAALRGVSLTAGPGEVVAVLGPSGAGKSTLLRIAALLLAPDAGRVLFDGAEARPGRESGPEPQRGRGGGAGRIGWVGQKPVVFRDRAVANVALGLRAAGQAGEEALREAGLALERVGLGARREQAARRLSGGEQQRVAFARAVVLRPALLVLDEFTANLDPGNAGLLEGEVRRLAREGAAVLMATHDLAQAARLADRIALLLDGRVVEEGPAKALLERPRTAEARAFVAGERLP